MAYSSLLILLLTLSCKKEESPHPLVGDSFHYSKEIPAGPIYPTEQAFISHFFASVRYKFKENNLGERTYEVYPVCVDEHRNSIRITSNELIQVLDLCGFVKIPEKYLPVSENENFVWSTQGSLLEIKYNSYVQSRLVSMENFNLVLDNIESEYYDSISYVYSLDENTLTLTTQLKTNFGDIDFDFTLLRDR